MDASDAQDVNLARAGDDTAFRRLVERHSRAVFQVAFRMTGSEPDAEDIVQDTFLKAYRELRRFESRSSFATWLHRIAVNCSYDLLRRRPRQQAEPLEAEGDTGASATVVEADAVNRPDRLAFSAEVQRRIHAAMQQLTPAERMAFALRHLEGRSIDEIGSLLGLQVSATKHSIFRAVQKMRRALTPLMDSRS
jgi:RNA polymerase sigma-70 factor (ECF subfamily)